MTRAHVELSKKLADPKRLEKLLEALRAGRPPWTVGIMSDEKLVMETLGFMGVLIEPQTR